VGYGRSHEARYVSYRQPLAIMQKDEQTFNNMKLKKLILFGLLIATRILNGQTDFRPGYIIKTTGDTIFGQIDYRDALLMSKVCKFKDKESEIAKYNPNDIIAFRFIDSKYYVSREINNRKVFLEYLIKGKINIYFMRDNNGDHYYLDKEDVKLTEMQYEEGIKYIDDKQVFYESTKHIGILSYYMQDAPNMQSEINAIKKPDHQNLIKLAKDYHNAVCDGEKCIIYEKSAPLIKILPELVVGVIKYSNVEDLNDKFYVHAGIIGHIWMPRTSEKMYFRTGVLLSQLYFNGEKENFYKIPCQFEYIYPKGIIRPRIAYGLNYYIPKYQTVSFDIGANIKLSETFFLSATSDIEFNPLIMIVPISMLSYTFKLGLFLSFK
jgi:hypothetical protein